MYSTILMISTVSVIIPVAIITGNLYAVSNHIYSTCVRLIGTSIESVKSESLCTISDLKRTTLVNVSNGVMTVPHSSTVVERVCSDSYTIGIPSAFRSRLHSIDEVHDLL